MPFKSRYDEMIDLYRDEPQPSSGSAPAEPLERKPAEDLYPSMAPKNRQKESWELLNTTPCKLTTAQILYPKMLEQELVKKNSSEVPIWFRNSNGALAASSPPTSAQDEPLGKSGRKPTYEGRGYAHDAPTIRDGVQKDSVKKSESSGIAVIRRPRPVSSSQDAHGQQDDLDEVERLYRGLTKVGRMFGLEDAADNLERFLSRTGEEKLYSREQARQSGTVRAAEETNLGWHLRNILTGEGEGNPLRTLQDGEAERKFSMSVETDMEYPQALVGGPKAVLAHGRTTVRSPATFFAMRSGDEIAVRGFVDQDWEDLYDFHEGGFLADGALKLEQAGRAKRFPMKGVWGRELNATIKVLPNGALQPIRWTWREHDW